LRRNITTLFTRYLSAASKNLDVYAIKIIKGELAYPVCQKRIGARELAQPFAVWIPSLKSVVNKKKFLIIDQKRPPVFQIDNAQSITIKLFQCFCLPKTTFGIPDSN